MEESVKETHTKIVVDD
jgi:hypothetical protein